MLLIVTGIKTPECECNVELALQKETIKDDVITIIPVSHGKCGEDKERKKIRDRLDVGSVLCIYLLFPSLLMPKNSPLIKEAAWKNHGLGFLMYCYHCYLIRI